MKSTVSVMIPKNCNYLEGEIKKITNMKLLKLAFWPFTVLIKSL